MYVVFDFCNIQVDIIGPHYTSEVTVDHKFLLPTVMDAMFKFHKCGFDTSAIVCDGASSNLTMIKEMTGADRTAYGWVFKIAMVNLGLHFLDLS